MALEQTAQVTGTRPNVYGIVLKICKTIMMTASPDLGVPDLLETT